MHTCKPPRAALKKWLKDYPSVEKRYGHLLLEQISPGNDGMRADLTPYFESAHLDARTHFHQLVGISLHPDDDNAGSDAVYPNSLPPITRSGLFGEVMCGMTTEAFKFVGDHDWVVPVFLFRHHEDAGQYLFTLMRDTSRTREVLGRKGDDFIGLVIDNDGKVARFIAGEAKWRKTWNDSTLDEVLLGKKDKRDPNDSTKKIHNGKGVWFEINRALAVPLGIRQLRDILEKTAPDKYRETICSLDRILMHENPDRAERTDLILLTGGGAASREEGVSIMEWQQRPPEYTANRDLQVVELILTDGEQLVKALYDHLYEEA